MAFSLARCRCCKGVQHRLPRLSPLIREISTASVLLIDSKTGGGGGGFKLPSRDWSRPPAAGPRGDKNDGRNRRNSAGDNRGPRRGGAGGERRDAQGGPSNRNRGSGSGQFNRDRNNTDSLGQGLSKWGVSSDRPPIGAHRPPGSSLASGFGLRSSKDKKGGPSDIIDRTRKTDKRSLDRPNGRGPSAFGDLLGGVGGSSLGDRRNGNPLPRLNLSGKYGDKPEVGQDDNPTSTEKGPLYEGDAGNDDGEAGFGERRGHSSRDRRGGNKRETGGSLLARLRDQEEASLPSRAHHKRDRLNHLPSTANGASSSTITNAVRKPKGPKPKVIEEEKEVYIPRTVSTANLAKIFGVKLFHLQTRMMRLDMSEDQRRSDYLLNAEQACDIAIEYGFNPVVDDEASFDIYPDPDPTDMTSQPLRPPVVTIMGHVDHGKTTLLDSLRHTSVAASEAGGITQHIGAFSVPLSSLLPSAPSTSTSSAATITFLDTPGHAAFTAMRARGTSVTDIVVLVVAADDGVMPQTKEVIELVKSEGDKVGMVVAINKCDKPGIDLNKVKSALGAEGVHLEEDGGDTPSVQVSGLTKLGLDNLVETLSTLAEIRDLRARKEGKAEGYVLESRVDKGRGNVATVLVSKGTLRTGASIVAGQTWCRVRQMQDDKGKAIREALPGTPVSITGWKDLPSAGDELLEAVKGEDEAKKAVNNRKRDEERKRLMADVEQINAKRREERLRLEAEAAAAEAAENGETGEGAENEAGAAAKAKEDERKMLRLVIKADVSGTVEAVVGSLEHIGNKEAGVKIIHTGVGDVTESDVALAQASDATVIGFNVSAARSIQTSARSSNVPLQLESVIYRLIDSVRTNVAALLPPKIEYSVKGEASVIQLFEINMKRKQMKTIAGCRVNNGIIDRNQGVRVLRGKDEQGERKVVYEGTIETLKHLKKEVQDVRKGMECGIALEGFTDIREGDEIVNFTKIEVPREL
ncbi:translation initiation factor IF-2 [Kwoniella sp. CBS 6097]